MYVCQVIVIILLEIIGRSKNLLWYWWRCTLNCAFKKIKNWHKWKWTFIARVTKYNQPHSIRPRDTQEARRDQNTDPRLDRQGPSTTTPPRDDNNTHTKRAPNTRGQGPSHPRRPQRRGVGWIVHLDGPNNYIDFIIFDISFGCGIVSMLLLVQCISLSMQAESKTCKLVNIY
jgi:hypothetical protein